MAYFQKKMDYPADEDFLEPDDYELYESQYADEFEMMNDNFESKKKGKKNFIIFALQTSL